MIKSIKNIGSKFLIIIIALSFAVWGIGDIFLPNGNNPTIAKVSRAEIKLNEFQLDYQLLANNLRQSSSQPMTEDFLRAIGLHNNVIEGLITKKYINFMSENLQVNVSDKYVKKAILNNPLFIDQLGVFNKDYFNYYLNSNNLKEKDIYKITKEAISNDLLIKSLNFSEFVPNKIAETILNKRDIVRKAKIYTFDTSAMLITEKKFTEAAIQEKYNDVKKNFLTPEKRNIKLVTFLYKSEKSKINISDEEVEKFYNENINLFESKETRDVYMVQFKNKNEMESFLSTYDKEKNFLSVLNKFNKSKENSFLKNITKNDLDENSREIVFNLNAEEISKMIETSFGYKVFYLEKIHKANKKPLTEIKKEIRKDLLTEKTNEKIYSTANTFYEKFLQSNDLSQSMENLQLSVENLSNVGLKNIESVKKLETLGLSNNEITSIIFNLQENDISEIIEDKNNNLHFIYLEKIIPAKEREFDDLKSEIVNILYDDARDKFAKELAQEFKENYLIKNYQKDYKNKFFNIKLSEWITLDNRLGKDIPLQIKKAIFLGRLDKLSDVIIIKPSVYAFVVPLKQSLKILSDDERNNISNITVELNNSLESDLNNAIINDLSKLYKSNINQKFLDSF